MTIKSLLLGSAAALVASTGANAADAFVAAEPEPVEYVRVCDAFGTGYFYIPGTETCLQFSGYMRYQVSFASGSNAATHASSARLNTTVKSDTAYGTLTGYARLEGAGGGTVSLTQVYIELGGLHMGYTDNAFDGGITGENDSLGGAKMNRIAYKFSSGAISGQVSLDDDASGNFAPDVSANIGGTFGSVTARAYAAYDETASNFAAKLTLSAAIGDGTLALAGVYADKAGNYSFGASEWSIAGAYTHALTSTVTASLGAQYWDNFYTAGAITGAVVGGNGFSVGANVDWKPVTNFLVRARVQYTDTNTSSGATTGYLRFERSF